MGQLGKIYNKMSEIKINFTPYSDDPMYLHVGDLSEWAYAEKIPSYISITVPGSKKEKNFSFVKYKKAIFNSNNLGLSCLRGDCEDQQLVDLPDGIYTITLKSELENIEKTKYYLKTDRFNIEFAKVMIQCSLDNCKDDFLDYMVKIKGIMLVAESHAMLGDFVKSHRHFEVAKKMLRKQMECKDCI